MNGRCATMMVALLTTAGIVSVPAWGSVGPQEDAGGNGPPQAAIEACREKSEGAAVEITTPRGDTITAICQQVDGRLVAVPDGGVPVPGNGAPPPAEGKGQ